MLVPKVWLPQAHAKKGTKGNLGEPYQPKMSKNENSIFVFQNFLFFILQILSYRDREMDVFVHSCKRNNEIL